MGKIYECPKCGSEMTYNGVYEGEEYERLAETDSIDWECLKCGTEAYLAWDDVNDESYMEIPEYNTHEDIYADPVGNMPECCIGCSDAYPKCMASCKLFDK